MPTKMEGYRFGPLLDSTRVTGSVFTGGAWVSAGSRAMDPGHCRKVELKSMCEDARYHPIDYRWDNFRLFLRPERWPVRFVLADADSVDLTGDYVLVVERESDGALVGRDTLGVSSEFAIRLDLGSLVIPETLRLSVLRDFTEPIGTVLLPASGVDGCYPDDAYVLYLDTSATVTGLADRGGRESPVPAMAPVRPNPCGRSAPITFTISAEGDGTPVALGVYDIRGRLVRALLDETIGTGPKEVIWDGYDGRGLAAPPGVYAIRLESPAGSATRRIVLVR